MSDPASYLDRWSRLHSDLPAQGLARRWLLLCYPLARALRRCPPLLLTLAALVCSLAVPLAALPGGRWPFLAAALTVAGGVLDNLDGAVAALTDRATTFGAVVDSVCDRLADSACLLVFWLLGGPGWLAGGAAFLAGLQEYVRARAAGLGLPALPITAWERPTRVILVTGILLGCGIFPGAAGPLATAGAAAAVALGLGGLTQLAR